MTTTTTPRQLILELFNHKMIKFGDFVLKSGKRSYIYVDVRTAITYPHIFHSICCCYAQLIKDIRFDFICGVPYSALTFASALAYAHKLPMVLKRKEMKEYGTKKLIEGDYQPGQNCLVLEDIITTGASIMDTVKALEEHQLKITDICALIERNQGGLEDLQSKGYRVHYIMNLHQIIEVLFVDGLISLQDKQKAIELL